MVAEVVEVTEASIAVVMGVAADTATMAGRGRLAVEGGGEEDLKDQVVLLLLV